MRSLESRLTPATPIHPSEAARLMCGSSFVANNRLVILLAFDGPRDPARRDEWLFLRNELLWELRDIAQMRLLPHGRPMTARTIYRLFCVKDLLGSADWNVPSRIALWSESHKRNERSGREVARLIQQFHRQASRSMSRGQVPEDLVDELLAAAETEHPTE